MKKTDVQEKWDSSQVNKRGIVFIERRREFLEIASIVTEVVFLLSGAFSITKTTSAIGKHDSLQISCPDCENSPNIAYLDVDDIIHIHFPTEAELQEIFGDFIQSIPEGYAPFFYHESGPQYQMKEQLKKNPEILSTINDRFFPKRVLIVCAHDDDSILGVGGTILQHLQRGDGDYVHIVTCHDGRTSHRAVFQREVRPSLSEVGNARKKELACAMDRMGVMREFWRVLNLSGEEGRPSQNMAELEKELHAIFAKIQPQIVYYHLADAHPDHRAVAEVTGKILQGYSCNNGKVRPKSFQFMIWTRELAEAQGQSNMDSSQAPEVPDNAIRIQLNKTEAKLKRYALHCMKSQIQTWPYGDWDPQPHAVLNEQFLRYFLRGEEIIIPV